MNFFHTYRFLDLSKNIFQKILIQNCKKFAIKKINFQNNSEEVQHSKMVKLVEQILEVKKKLLNVKTEKDKTYYNRQCYKIDNQIDNLVYKLYGLTDEDIKIVEGRYTYKGGTYRLAAFARARRTPTPGKRMYRLGSQNHLLAKEL